MAEPAASTYENIQRPVSVAIVSKGRPDVLDDTLESVFRQTVRPHQVIVVVTAPEDLPRKPWGDAVQILFAPAGTSVQRNKALEVIPLSVDFVAYFDDDVELRPDYLEQALLFFERNPNSVALSGRLIGDGQITREEGRRRLEAYAHKNEVRGLYHSAGDLHSLHGCNMVIRRAFLDYEKFDENLALYGFAEDYDLSMRLERYGRVGKFARCVAVHLAWPHGRVNEVQRGYCLIANQWYCIKKGTVHVPPFQAQIWYWNVVVRRMIFATIRQILRRNRACDWKGRLKGALLALTDIARGRCDPRRVLELEEPAKATQSGSGQ